MNMKFDTMKPMEIEKRSFEIIESELKFPIDEKIKPVVKRVIHTTADFSYAETLCFSENAIDDFIKEIKNGTGIITDTNMAKAGINKKACEKFGINVECFMSDKDVAEKAKKDGTTRAIASIDKACERHERYIFVVGNAPTALIRLYELIEEKKIKPAAIVGVPVGFVNVVEAKELIISLKDIPFIVARGRKGGSNVAASIINALMYMAGGRE